MTPELYDLLTRISEYLDRRADISSDDPNKPNDAMRLQMDVDAVLRHSRRKVEAQR